MAEKQKFMVFKVLFLFEVYTYSSNMIFTLPTLLLKEKKLNTSKYGNP